MATQLIGREAAEAGLQKLAAQALQGEGRIAFISGAAGCGKSALVHGFLTSAKTRIFRVRACRQAPPFALARQLLLQLLPAAEMPIFEGAEPAAHMAELLFQHLPQEPITIFFDDLQESDPGSLACLRLLFEALASRPIFFLCTVRTDSLPRRHPLRDFRSEFRRSGRFQEFEVEPLNESECGLLLKSLFDEPISEALRQEIYRCTRGIPFLIEELATTLRRTGLQPGTQGLERIPGAKLDLPEASRDLLLDGYLRLSDACRAACETAAIRGCEFALWELQQIIGADTGIDEAIEAGLFQETEEASASFRQVLTQEAIYAAIPWSRRRLLHLRWAEFLEQNGEFAHILAYHFENGGDRAKARRHHLAAGEEAVRLRAYPTAAGSFSAALQLWPETQEPAARFETVRRFAGYAHMAGQLAAAGEAWRQCIRFAEDQEDAANAGAAWQGLANVLAMEGKDQPTLDARETAARHFAEAGKLAAAAEELLTASYHLTDKSRAKPAEDCVRRAMEWIAQTKDLRLESLARIHLGLTLAMQGKCAAAEREVTKGLELALKHQFQDAAILGYRRMAHVHEYSSDYKGEREFHQAAIRICRIGGGTSMEHLCLGCMAYGQFRAGEWADSLKICADLLGGKSDPVGICIAEGVSGLVRLHRGELRAARKLLASAEAACRVFQVVPMLLAHGWGGGLAAEERGDLACATEYYLEALTLWENTDDRHDILPLLPVAATFFAANGDAASLERCAACARIVANTGNSEPLAVLAMVEGECALAQKDPASAKRHFEHGVDLFSKLHIPFETARARYRAGVALLRHGARDEASEMLAIGSRDARNLGARPLAGRILREMEAAGIAAGKSERTKRDGTIKGGLTPRQREVARLLSEGRTNKEIADRMFLSVRTVEMHVAHLLERLDCRSRSEAAGKLAASDVLS